MVTIITKFMFLFVICAMVSIPVSAEILELSSPGINIYSDVDQSWDYSTRYELVSTKETTDSTSYSISWVDQYACNYYHNYLYESHKPTQIFIDFSLNPSLSKIEAKSIRGVSSSFIEGCSFNLMDGSESIAYGSFYMMADTDNKLLFLYFFDDINVIAGSGTYNILYSDNSIFSVIADKSIIASQSGYESHARCGYVNPSGSGIYLKSIHSSTPVGMYSCPNGWGCGDAIDEMATTNTITNNFVTTHDILYYYNSSSYIGYTDVVNYEGTYRLGLTHNLSSSNTESSNDYYIFDLYGSSNVTHNSNRLLGVKFDLYVDSTNNNPEWSYVLDWGGSFCGPTGYYATTSVDWDADDYIIGATGSISYLIDDYDSSTYDYSIDIYKSGILQTYLPCSSGSGIIDYTFSDIVSDTSYSAKLTKYVKGSMIPLLIDCDDCMVYMDSTPDSCQIEFDKEIYGPDDLVNMSYLNCPNGSHIFFRSDTSPYYDSKTYVSISGNGSVSYQLSGAPAGIGYYVKVCTPGNIIIASDTMEIEGIVVGYCQVHGGIYDSQDYHPLIGTVFIGDSYSDVVAYDDYGGYSITVPWGTYDISTVVSSYCTYNISNVEIFDSDYNLNMFMSVNGTTTHVFRGSVMDTNTKTAIEDVLIKVYNDTFDEYDFTSQSGVWIVNGLTAGTNYTLHATKDDYHSYTYSFTYDPYNFYHNFMMSPSTISEDVPEDVLEGDESMTEYFDEKFRDFAPTIWGLFMCMCVLFFASILNSFNSGNQRR